MSESLRNGSGHPPPWWTPTEAAARILAKALRRRANHVDPDDLPDIEKHIASYLPVVAQETASSIDGDLEKTPTGYAPAGHSRDEWGTWRNTNRDTEPRLKRHKGDR